MLVREDFTYCTSKSLGFLQVLPFSFGFWPNVILFDVHKLLHSYCSLHDEIYAVYFLIFLYDNFVWEIFTDFVVWACSHDIYITDCYSAEHFVSRQNLSDVRDLLLGLLHQNCF